MKKSNATIEQHAREMASFLIAEHRDNGGIMDYSAVVLISDTVSDVYEEIPYSRVCQIVIGAATYGDR